MSKLRLMLCTAGLACCALHARPARATEDSCFESALQGQKLRKSGKLLAAREQFSSCASASCPVEVVERCSEWLRQVDGDLPSIVIVAADENGRDIQHGEVSMDGKVLPGALLGRSIPVDPGAHQLRLTIPGRAPSEQSIVVQETVKGRRVAFLFRRNPRGRPAPVSTRPTSRPSRRGGIPTSSLILGGVGLAAFGAGAYFGVRGARTRTEKGCDVGCSHDDYQDVERDFLIADVAFGFGVVSLGTATVLYATRTPSADSRTTGAFVGARGRF